MSVTIAAIRKRRISGKRFKLGTSLVALAAIHMLAPVSARAEQPFGTLVGMQAGRTIGADGQVSVWQGANLPVLSKEGDRDLMTIVQTQKKAILDWEDFRLQTQEILEFQQQASDWFVINRVHGSQAAEIHGEIRAIGSVYVFNDNGVLIGDDALINTRQLVVGSGISDVDIDGDTTTFVQSRAKAALDWQKFEVATGQVLKFEQQAKDWLVINRDLTEPANTGNAAALAQGDLTLHGTIEAKGIVVLEDKTGFDIGEDAQINAERYFLTQNIADVNVAGNGFEFTQGDERAIINWSDMNLAEGQSITIHQNGDDWMALNRSIAGGVVALDGMIRADEGLLLVARDGLVINGAIEAGQVVASALEIRDTAFLGFHNKGGGLFSFSENDQNSALRLDPTFSNSWIYPELGQGSAGQTVEARTDRYLNLLNDEPIVVDPNDAQHYAVTVGAEGSISTDAKGKIMLFGPNVYNKGVLSVRDEGQVILAAGENIFIDSQDGVNLDVYTSGYNPLDVTNSQVSLNYLAPAFLNVQYDRSTRRYYAQDSVIPTEWVDFVNTMTGGSYQAGDLLPGTVGDTLVGLNGSSENLVSDYVDALRAARVRDIGFTAVNEGIITGTGGSDVTMRGWNVEQNGAITLTSTANFRALIDLQAVMQDQAVTNGTLENNLAGNGTVVFGKGSLTQITPDLDADDTLPLTQGNQSVGNLFVAGQYVHLQDDSLIYMPSGTAEFYVDADATVLDPLGASGNANSQDGSRFLMEGGATIDLSGWDVTREMGYHQVTGTVYVAQLADSPVQDGGPLYRKEISVDRRYGTEIVDWETFDNLNQLTLDQMIVDGGTLKIAVGDDFIMKSGAVIDVSGGSITYDEGYVYTTLLRRLDGSIIDIREADPDEIYMGLANEWVVYDPKWGKQETYYVPLMSSSSGQWEDSYVEGGNAGTVNVWAPDGVYQGTFLGDVTVGKYQKINQPDAGALIINAYGEYDEDYLSQRLLIANAMAQLDGDFGLYDSLTSVYGDLFGEEEERTGSYDAEGNLTLLSADLFERSTMGRYELTQYFLGEGQSFAGKGEGAYGNYYSVVEDGVDLNFANGATFDLIGTGAMYFGGSLTTNGGDVALRGQGITFAADSFIDTSAAWYSEFELYDYVPLADRPIVDGGDIMIMGFYNDQIVNEADADYAFVIPETVGLSANGGGYLDREGNLTAGKGGDIYIRNFMALGDSVDLSGAFNAQSYGLGGNGQFTLETSGEIYVGDELPEDLENRHITALIAPDFYENMPFSGVYLSAPKVTIAPGMNISATKATMQLDPATLLDGVPSAWLAEPGTDILDVTTIGYVEPGYRDAALQDGADLAFTPYIFSDDYTQISLIHLNTFGEDGDVRDGALLTEDSSITVNPGGSILYYGNVAGTLEAPAGTISLGGVLSSTARILAPGAVRITDRTLDSNGNELVSGIVLDGGVVNSGGSAMYPLIAEDGAIIDVSGTSAELNIAKGVGGSVVRELTTIASDGGSVNFSGSSLDVNNITFLASGGGEGARGGTFTLQWIASDYEAVAANIPLRLVSKLNGTFRRKQVGSNGSYWQYGLAGVDLSTIDWGYTGQGGDYFVSDSLDFAEGTFLPDFTTIQEAYGAWYDAQAAAPAPIFYIGEGELPRIPDYSALPQIDPTFLTLYETLGYGLPVLSAEQTSMSLSPQNIAAGGFSSVQIAATSAMVVSGQSQLGGLAADGTYLIDEVVISAPKIYGQADAGFTALANVVRLLDSGTLNENGGNFPAVIDEARFAVAIEALGVSADNIDTSFAIEAGRLVDITSADFLGFEDVTLNSGGDIRFTPNIPYVKSFDTPEGALVASGNLTLKADQLYAASGRIFTVEAGDTLTILPPDEGSDINKVPLEGGASLTLRAPRIVQGGIVRSPLGSITLESWDDGSEGADSISLLAGSLTSVSADGNIIPYGTLQNGDTWVDPFTKEELTYLPDRTVTIAGNVIDFAEGAVVDISAGGDLAASEFVAGVGGTTDWLTGYRNEDYEWVADSSEVFAIIPGYDADVTPLGTGNGYGAQDLGKIYLSGANAYGLPEGEYTLLPAEYASLPGAYRVTANHQYGDYGNMVLGTTAPKADGSVIQAGYRFTANADGSVQYRDPYTNGYLVMSGEVLAKRSTYNTASATSYFDSEAFLAAALRTNLEVDSLPRTPNDGGGLAFVAGSSLTLDGAIDAEAAEGGKGGYLDIVSGNILVSGADTDLSAYDGYLVLDADKLASFGVESLLLGGSRYQTDTGAAITVGAGDLVIDTAGDTLSGADMIFAAIGGVTVKSGSVVEATGELTSPTEAYRIDAAYGLFQTGQSTPSTNDDVFVHVDLDRGALLHVSAGERADFLRDSAAVDAMAELLATPAALAAANARRASEGLAPISAEGGVLTIEDGAALLSSRSLVLDATADTVLAGGATLGAKQITASASQVSIGDVPAVRSGLIFTGDTAAVLSSAEDVALKSYSSIDFYGDVEFVTEGDLTLDTREIRLLDNMSGTARIQASNLTLANSNGGQAVATGGIAELVMTAENITLSGGMKAISGADNVTLTATGRMMGRDDGGLTLPGNLTLEAGQLSVNSGDALAVNAAGLITVNQVEGAEIAAADSFGATLALNGSAIAQNGRIALNGGTVSMLARDGDIALSEGSVVDVSGTSFALYDVTIGVDAGRVNLTADHGDVVQAEGALIDISGGEAADAGALAISVVEGSALLNGTLSGGAAEGHSAGDFDLLIGSLPEFGGLSDTLTAGGLNGQRSFEILSGDVTLDGTTEVEGLSLVVNDGAIHVTGSVTTTGAKGGTIALAASGDVTLAGGSALVAAATAQGGAGGKVRIETAGTNDGAISMASGALIDVSGMAGPEGEEARGGLVHFRAPQIGSNDVAITQLAGTITGADRAVAEAYAVYEDVAVIDQAVIDTVEGDATGFMNAALANGVENRLGSVSLIPGIDIRNQGDIELAQEWDLSSLRFGPDDRAGVLSLRASGDLLINANLTDSDTASGSNWDINLVAGANLESPAVLAVLAQSLLADGKGSVIIGGEVDALDITMLNANDYDMTIEVGGVDYGSGFSELFSIIDGWIFSKGITLPDAEVMEYYYSAEDVVFNQGGIPDNYVEGYYLIKNFLETNPEYYAVQSSNATRTYYAGLTYINSRILRDAEALSELSDEAVVKLTELYGRRVNGNEENNKPYYVEFVNYMLGNYPDVINKYYFEIEQSVDAAPYYLRVNGTESALYNLNADGSLGVELERDFTTGKYIDPVTGALIEYAAGAKDYADTDYYTRNPLDWIVAWRSNYDNDDYATLVQTYNPQGYVVGTNGAALAVAAGRDLVLEQRPSSLQTTGAGSSIMVNVAGDIIAHDDVAKTVATDILTEGSAFIAAGGKIDNLSVKAMDMDVRAGGDIAGGIYDVTGTARITSGGAIVSGSEVVLLSTADPIVPYDDCPSSSELCHYHQDPTDVIRHNPFYTLFYANEAGDLQVKSAGDLNIETATGGAEARVAFYSAGGDIITRSNDYNIASATLHDEIGSPYYVSYSAQRSVNVPNIAVTAQTWGGTVELVAAGGDVNILGGFAMAPYQYGNLDVLAQGSVQIGTYQRAADVLDVQASAAERAAREVRIWTGNYHSAIAGIYSTSDLVTQDDAFYQGYAARPAGLNLLLHEGDSEPSRIYTGAGNINLLGGVYSAEQTWIKSGGNIYFPQLLVRHSQASDVTQVTAAGGIYFSDYIAPATPAATLSGLGGYIAAFGEGRLKIEAGTDLWIPDNARGITSDVLMDMVRIDNYGHFGFVEIDPDMKSADISISVGYNQRPDYEAFEAAYFDPEFMAGMADYLRVDLGSGEELPFYLFDSYYARGNGAKAEVVTGEMAGGFVNYIRSLQGLEALPDEAAQRNYLDTAWEYWVNLPAAQETPFDALIPRYTAAQSAQEGLKGEYFLPEQRQGLVNYVRELQGLEALASAEEQAAYMDEALAYWDGLNTVYKTPFYRSVLFLEMRTSSREANDVDSDRAGSVNRGYDAIATLYPGAQKAADEQLADGESRWDGNLEIFAAPILSNAGGDVSVVAPGGFVRLASAAATAEQIGQSSESNPQGNALRAGIVTQGGGEVNVLSHGDIDVNQARVLTSQGGNVLMWSSYGDIAAGNGAKTSIAPPYYDRSIDELANLNRSPAGLPTGAGIGTLASTPGVPPADVDLVANYGVVDAGDAGIRVSGNLNVFAIEVLGLDNIDVAGRTTGLPEAPAAPPTSLDVGDIGSKSLLGGDLLKDLAESVRRNAASTTPSLIEVRVTGYGDGECEDGRKREQCAPAAGNPQSSVSSSSSERADIGRVPTVWSNGKLDFDIAAVGLDDAMKEMGRLSGYNILYNSDVAANFRSQPVRGSMTLREAMSRLLGQGLRAVLIDDRTIMIEANNYAYN
ncbi:MAG: filamentous hemagglutinin family protein [Tsuneonella suprasediminis]